MAINIYVVIRMVLGAFFMVSGFEKLIEPPENFLYVVQGYEIFPEVLESAVVMVLPWIEFFLGIFMLAGLWFKQALRALCLLLMLFILVVFQALLRKLPITECGCFGSLFSFPLKGILIFDTVLLALTAFLIRRQERAESFSLDRYFSRL